MPTAKKTSKRKAGKKSTKTSPKTTTGRKRPPRISELPEKPDNDDDDDDVQADEPEWKERCQDLDDNLHELHALVMGAMTTKIRLLERQLKEALERLTAMESDASSFTERLDDCEGLLLEAFPAEEGAEEGAEEPAPDVIVEGAANDPS